MKEKQKTDLIQIATKKEGQNVMYIGPSFLGIVQSNTTFANGYPPKFKEVLKKHTFLNGLLIPVDSLGQAMKTKKFLLFYSGQIPFHFYSSEKEWVGIIIL